MKLAGDSRRRSTSRRGPSQPDSLPLGAKPDAGLNPDQLRTLRVLAEYDLTRVRDRLRDRGIMPAGWVDEAIFEFRRYLGLRIVTPGPIPMLSHQIDDVWHVCLMFTRLYADLCQKAFGTFVHHEPADGPDPNPAVSWRLFEETYESLYGKPGRLWLMARHPPR